MGKRQEKKPTVAQDGTIKFDNSKALMEFLSTLVLSVKKENECKDSTDEEFNDEASSVEQDFVNQIVFDEKDFNNSKTPNSVTDQLALSKQKCNELENKLNEKDQELKDQRHAYIKLEQKFNSLQVQNDPSANKTLIAKKEEELEKLQMLLDQTQTKFAYSIAKLKREINQLKAADNSIDLTNEDLRKMEDEIKTLKTKNASQVEQLRGKTGELEKMKSIVTCGGTSLVDALKDSALKFSESQDFAKAIQHFDDAIELEKSGANDTFKLADLYLWKAQTYSSMKEYRKAVRSTTSALVCRPKCTFSLETRAEANFELKNWNSVRQDVNELLAIDPNDKKAKEMKERVQTILDAEDGIIYEGSSGVATGPAIVPVKNEVEIVA